MATNGTQKRLLWLMGAAVALVLGLTAVSESPIGPTLAEAVTYQVTRLDDPAPDGCNSGTDCSLREAVIAANADNTGAHTIQLAGGSTYALTIGGDDDVAALGDLDITNTSQTITIETTGGGNAVIDASGMTPTRDRVFHVLTGRSLVLEGITVTGGNASFGGGIAIAGATGFPGVLELTMGSVVTGNSSSAGGGISNAGTLTVDASFVRGNTAVGGGGGIGGGGTTIIQNGSVIGGSGLGEANTSSLTGGGISVTSSSGNLTINASSVIGNLSTATNGAGGIASTNGATLTIENGSTIAMNRVPDDGSTGGIRVYGTTPGPISITNSRFIGNSGTAVGAFRFDVDSVDNFLFENNCLVGNSDVAVTTVLGATMDFENNWWGAADGPSGEGPGSGDSVGTNIDFDPFLVADPFTNNPCVIPGEITVEIVKEVMGASDRTVDFPFSSDIPNCTIGTLDDDDDPTYSNTVICEDVPGDAQYTVTETLPDGWNLGIECTTLEGTEVEWNTDDNDGVVLDLVEPTTGDVHVRCVFQNREGDEFLVITKDVQDDDDGEDPQSFTYTTNIPGCEILGPLADYFGQDVIYGNQAYCYGVDWDTIGDVTIEEEPQPGWVITSITCSGGSGGGLDPSGYEVLEENGRIYGATIFEGAVNTNLTQGAGCRFVNEQVDTGSIVIIKDVPGQSGTNFTFTDDIPDYVVGPLDDDISTNDALNATECLNVPVDDYTVTENLLSGWELVDIVCESTLPQTAPFDVDVNSRSVDIDLEAFEEVTCTFFNEPTDDPRPTRTPTPTATSTATPTATATETATVEASEVYDSPDSTPYLPVLPPTRTPTPTPTSASVGSITPPSTGDGGVSGGSTIWLVVGLAGFAVAVAVGLRLAGLSVRRR